MDRASPKLCAECVEELILNSIDAEATCVAVNVDIEACKVQVIDNGSGMDREDMERVGNRYYTSKCSSLEDLDNLRFYGFRGEAVASIVSLATLVEISSRTKLSVKTFVKIFDEGKGLDVFESETTRPSAGTTVVICNFFHNMPVRRKRMDCMLEIERIRQRVEAISLMHPSVSFTVKKDCSGAMVVQLSKARNTYYRFVQIHGLGRAQRLGEISYSYVQFEMTGHIGRESHYNNSLQFLFVNGRLLLKTRIHKLLNCLLRRVSSSAKHNNSPSASPVTSSPKQRSGAELHGVYVINIKCHYSEYDICLEPAKTLIEFRDWDGVLLCIEEGVKAFLTKENLVAEFSLRDIQDYASQTVYSGQAVIPARAMDDVQYIISECNEQNMLTSKPVQRSIMTEFKDKDTVCQTCDGVDKGGEKGDEVSDNEIQREMERVFEPVSTDAECEPSSVDTEREAQQYHLVSKTATSISKSPNDHNKEEKLDGHQKDAVRCDFRDYELPLCVNNNKMAENPRMSVVDGKETGDGLRKSASPNQTSPCKRKLSLFEGPKKDYSSVCNIPSKISRVAPRPKLSLSFETGSLDKFRRMYVRQAEESTQPIHSDGNNCALNTAASKTLDTALHSICNEEQEMDINKAQPGLLEDSPLTLSTYTKLKCASGPGRRNNISLAAKLSHLKHQTMEIMGFVSEELVEAIGNTDLCDADMLSDSVTQDISSEEKPGTFPSQDHPLPQCDVNPLPACVEESNMTSGCSGTCHALGHHHNDIPSTTSAHGPHITVVPTSTAEDMCHCAQTVGISESNLPSGQVLASTGQHGRPLPPSSGNDGQNTEEGENSEGGGVMPVSSDWLTHYDDAMGKLVYINTVTGLSKYKAPSLEETEASCTTDITNMAVSVISKKGGIQAPSSLSSLFSEWSNPVFVRPPDVAVDVTSGQAEGLAVKIHNILFPYRFTKDMIHSMKVIHQVDRKFLACLINTRDQETTDSSETEGNLLVLVDQHAAHERVRLERLVTDSYEDDPEAPGQRRLCSSSVTPPLEVKVTEEELRLLRSCQPFLRGLGLELGLPQTGEGPRVLLGKVPVCFMEKERSEAQRGRKTVIKSIVEDYIREQIELLHSTGRVRGTLPLTVHNVLASQACHGAIKFNHTLSKEECCSLVGSLSSCQLPFQCAHGRPSIAPLVDLRHLDSEQQELPKPNLRKLGRMYKAWQLYGNK